MTYQEMRDSIIARHKYEAAARNLPYVDLQDNLIYLWISKAESEIQRRIQALVTVIQAQLDVNSINWVNQSGGEYVNESGTVYTLQKMEDLTSVDVLNAYYITDDNITILGLPKIFGKEISVTTGGYEIKYKTLEEWSKLTSTSENTRYSFYTVYWNGSTQVMKLYPLQTDAYINIQFYNSILTFANSTLATTDKIQLPQEYYDLIETRVLAYLFRDYLNDFEHQLRSLREYRSGSKMETLPGENLGGVTI